MQRIDPAGHFDRLLGLCARGNEHPALHEALRAAAHGYVGWDALAQRAESHGIAPLVRHHLRAAQIELPPPVSRSFVGLELRHRKTNAMRESLLAELAAAFSAHSVPLLLLKGAALAFCVYPQPGLRAMRDIDVLVRPEDLPAAGEILRELGYTADDETSWASDVSSHHHHQKERRRVIDGSTFTIEVHRMLGIRDARVRRTLDQLWGSALAIPIGGATAHTLGATDMLVHVHHHAFCTRLHWPDRLRLVSVADLVTHVEAQLQHIDWAELRREHPRIWQALPWIELVTPWAASTRAQLGWPSVAAVAGVGRDYTGWPRERLDERRGHHQRLALLRETFAPPAWWMRMRHGGGPGVRGYIAGWWRHFDDVVL